MAYSSVVALLGSPYWRGFARTAALSRNWTVPPQTLCRRASPARTVPFAFILLSPFGVRYDRALPGFASTRGDALHENVCERVLDCCTGERMKRGEGRAYADVPRSN